MLALVSTEHQKDLQNEAVHASLASSNLQKFQLCPHPNPKSQREGNSGKSSLGMAKLSV